MTDKTASYASPDGPLGHLKAEAGNLAGAMAGRVLESVVGRIEGSTGRLKEYAENGGGPGLKAALTGASKLAEGQSGSRAMLSAGASTAKGAVRGMFGKGKGGGGGAGGGGGLKVTNIVESIDVGAPLRLVYDQWTEFARFPSFMKKIEKVEKVEKDDDAKLAWQAQVFLSHRGWEATIQQQLPDRRIVWTSEGQKGHVDGTVTFHELGPELTRILVVLEYYPQGFFEQTGNFWRAPGRRVRLELKHFRRYVMRQVILNPDDVEGWRGVIEDGEVVKDHETALQEERDQASEGEADGDGEQLGEDEDEYAEDEYDEGDEDDYEDDGADEEPDADDAEVSDEDEDRYDEDEAAQPEPARAGSRRGRRR